ncbi:Na+/H+ antiporter subunit E [Staphylothermus hellenicus]|uniref:Cation antiporter n=1 Tax=Staphylothermus hellenicus (strain DSM 12710 / JCM 10830 / BK20S6-10-b1 / P8) TaxID=591019 RepID=D7DAT2_STAHD|nr:Na+/H+ antiporter subunit E [Staphylothermus hellenicus]ADI31279.1 cation antiporter [Staphylothermus hellenicus DSM 12710]
MDKVKAIIALIIPLIIIYLIYTGSYSLFELLLGIIVAVFVAYLFGDAVVRNAGKIYSPIRWFWGLVYAILYFTIIEAKAHWEVIKLIFKPSNVKPAIVRIPYSVETDYAVTTIANSITNTPGTITIDVDENKKHLYVHWIRAVDLSDEGAWVHISSVFEKYAKKIFD